MAVAIVAGAVVGSTALVAGSLKPSHTLELPTPRTLDVTATAVRHLTPSHATWTITLHDRAADKAAAIAAVRSDADKARAWLVGRGIAENELAFAIPDAASDDSTVTRHQPDGSEIQVDVSSGFVSSLVITVDSRGVANVVAAAHVAGTTKELQGAEADEPSCGAADSDKLELPLLDEARKATRAKAEAVIEEYGGAKLGKLATAIVGTFEVAAACDSVTAIATAAATYEIE
jgi:hypothetical protein